MSSVETLDSPDYGASAYYQGEQGETYAGFLRRNADIKGELYARIFAPHIAASDIVIDFGCGVGKLLAHLDCSQRIGVEINPAARKDAEALGIRCVATLDELDNGIADVVISNHVLEHVPGPMTALTQLRNKLKSTGTLVLNVPIDDWRWQQRYNPADINHHLYTWTPLLLGHMLKECGFMVHPDAIRILHQTWPSRYYPTLYQRLPTSLFDAFCRAWAIITGRRSILVVVKPHPSA